MFWKWFSLLSFAGMQFQGFSNIPSGRTANTFYNVSEAFGLIRHKPTPSIRDAATSTWSFTLPRNDSDLIILFYIFSLSQYTIDSALTLPDGNILTRQFIHPSIPSYTCLKYIRSGSNKTNSCLRQFNKIYCSEKNATRIQYPKTLQSYSEPYKYFYFQLLYTIHLCPETESCAIDNGNWVSSTTQSGGTVAAVIFAVLFAATGGYLLYILYQKHVENREDKQPKHYYSIEASTSNLVHDIIDHTYAGVASGNIRNTVENDFPTDEFSDESLDAVEVTETGQSSLSVTTDVYSAVQKSNKHSTQSKT